MNITEIRVKLLDNPQERLQAFCSITFDSCFVVRDLKVIDGDQGLFVAMPSRKLTDRCPDCGNKNSLRSNYCEQCGLQLAETRGLRGRDGRTKLYADIAHPINGRCREAIQQAVVEAFEAEKRLAQQPNYVCRYDDYGEEEFAERSSSAPSQSSSRRARETV